MAAPGELRGKNTEELLEILERQEKLLSNKTFIAKLPDRGKKILDYTEKVRHAIAEQKELNKTTELLSNFRLEFQAAQHVTACTHSQENHEDNMVAHAQLDNMVNQSPTVKSVQNKQKRVTDITEMKPQSHLDTTNVSVPASTNQESPRNGTNAAGKSSLDTELLVNDLQKINLSGSNDNSSRSTSEISAVQDRNPFSTTPVKPTKSHFITVIEKRATNPIKKKEKFMANHLPSSSSSSSLNQSPGERQPKLSAEERRAQDKKHLDDITAARLPPLHHAPTQLMPLEESIALQIAQKQSYEEKQAKLAAQKLMEKLNIKVGTFNPEGDSYMKYRDLREDYETED
ncbi:protein GRINL1A [Discoglossus pictus]